MRDVIGLLAVVVIGTGCGTSAEDCHNTKTCPPPDAGVVYVMSDAGLFCDGVCVPTLVDITGLWSQPFVLWRGPTAQLTDKQCPPSAPHPSQPWFSTPDQTPLSCPACSCAPSTGSCALPVTVAVGTSPVCPSEAGDAGVPFDPPSDWDGGCTTNEAIPSVDCDGGPCLATVGSMTPIENGCTPIGSVVPKNGAWTYAAFACAGETNNGTCNDPGQVCAPTPPPVTDGFSVCVSRQGGDPIIECPFGYPKRGVYYFGGDDDRGCSPCECGQPQGDSCSSFVSLYSDDACVAPVGSVMALSSGPTCVSIPDGSPLGSKQASPPVYNPGTCQASGGEQTGSVTPIDPYTFCCQQ